MTIKTSQLMTVGSLAFGEKFISDNDLPKPVHYLNNWFNKQVAAARC